MNKKITILLIAIALLTGFVLLGSNVNKHPQQESSSRESQVSLTPTQKQNNNRVAVSNLAGDFDTNTETAEAKWKGKDVEFSATLSDITEAGFLFKNVSSNQSSTLMIICRIQDRQQLAIPKAGQLVTVKGTVGVLSKGAVDINNCSLVN